MIERTIATIRDKLCSMLAWEKQYTVKETSFKDRIKHALERITGDMPSNPPEVVLIAEGFGAWCLAEYGGQDLIALQRLDGRVQVFAVTTKYEKMMR